MYGGRNPSAPRHPMPNTARTLKRATHSPPLGQIQVDQHADQLDKPMVSAASRMKHSTIPTAMFIHSQDVSFPRSECRLTRPAARTTGCWDGFEPPCAAHLVSAAGSAGRGDAVVIVLDDRGLTNAAIDVGNGDHRAIG